MSDLPYTTVPAKISSLFKKIIEVGVPQKVNYEWLRTIGFKSKNDSTLIRVLSFINFVDSSTKSPTELWRKYRGSERGKALAQGILTGYTELFSIYPDAYNRRRDELKHFFREKSSVGERAVDLKVSTFQELCKLADFKYTQKQYEGISKENDESVYKGVELSEGRSMDYKGLVININIQLTLPETSDERVYDVFFSAMKRHLLQGEK